MALPVYERRFYLNLVKGLVEEEKEDNDEVTEKTGKKSRKTTISGESLKSKLKNNEINE